MKSVRIPFVSDPNESLPSVRIPYFSGGSSAIAVAKVHGDPPGHCAIVLQSRVGSLDFAIEILHHLLFLQALFVNRRRVLSELLCCLLVGVVKALSQRKEFID